MLNNKKINDKKRLMRGGTGRPLSNYSGQIGDWRYYCVGRKCANCGKRGWSAETYGEEARHRIQCPHCGLDFWQVQR